VPGEALGVTPPDRFLVFPLPHLDGEVLTTELLERELAEVPDPLDVRVVGPLNDRLVVGPFVVDLVRGEPIQYVSIGQRMEISLEQISDQKIRPREHATIALIDGISRFDARSLPNYAALR
jgi:hypothetical protein